MIAIIDYGAGNLQSVKNALDHLDAPNFVTSVPDEIHSADGVILPGVGAFGHAMDEINKRGIADAIRKAARNGKPFLGICVGMQLFFESSEESPGVPGLGLMQGKVVRFRDTDGRKVPHMGWNTINVTKESRLLFDLPPEPFFYFVHSYYVKSDIRTDVSATADYGSTFDAAVEDGSLFGLQFHPEKSGDLGLRILRRFVSLTARFI
ncbi:imidazole glycerol phosphate synthase subunit HisH [Synergistaceae bacterium OttesenSCG-928-D05]|nr:imidazole glycerol phosphate synthase subunit HisH [Synergistaceae bacterium OttesenSCG-928-D05]